MENLGGKKKSTLSGLHVPGTTFPLSTPPTTPEGTSEVYVTSEPLMKIFNSKAYHL